MKEEKGLPEQFSLLLEDGSAITMAVPPDLCGIVFGPWKKGDYGLPGAETGTLLRLMKAGTIVRARLWSPVVSLEARIRYPNNQTYTWTLPDPLTEGEEELRQLFHRNRVRGLFLWDQSAINAINDSFRAATLSEPTEAPIWARTPSIMLTRSATGPNIFRCPWIAHMVRSDR